LQRSRRHESEPGVDRPEVEKGGWHYLLHHERDAQTERRLKSKKTTEGGRDAKPDLCARRASGRRLRRTNERGRRPERMLRRERIGEHATGRGKTRNRTRGLFGKKNEMEDPFTKISDNNEGNTNRATSAHREAGWKRRTRGKQTPSEDLVLTKNGTVQRDQRQSGERWKVGAQNENRRTRGAQVPGKNKKLTRNGDNGGKQVQGTAGAPGGSDSIIGKRGKQHRRIHIDMRRR